MYSDRRKIGTGIYVGIHNGYGGIRKHFDTYLNLSTEYLRRLALDLGPPPIGIALRIAQVQSRVLSKSPESMGRSGPSHPV
jgi:hypothetical protein